MVGDELVRRNFVFFFFGVEGKRCDLSDIRCFNPIGLW